MGDGKTYDEVTKVTAKDGEVILDGPDGVDVKVTPEAAEETADALINGAMKANGQRRMRGNPHRAR
jgi:membrane peptidoglycan carboxypeptidase